MECAALTAFFNTYPLPPETIPAVTVRAQLYEVEESSKIFSPIEETLILLTPSFTNATPSGTLLKGEVRMNRPVEKNARDRKSVV